ncbi:MAG: VCBS repeat-containing protein [Saprospiraceae bacterium]|nr:VCBS repeat-containing protein [Saprospiraceae bacterium]
MRVIITFLLALFLLTALNGQSGFTKMTDTTNPIITFPFNPGEIYRGAAWVDVDNDRDIDLFVAPRFLFLNDSVGTFRSVDFGFSDIPVPTNGVSWADVDNDGDLDFFLASRPSKLYLNNGNAQFTSQALTTDTISTWGCTFGDGNNDGWIDLVGAHAFGFHADTSASFYFLNDRSGNLNLSPIAYDFTTTTAPYTVPYWSDFDLDGDLDLFIASGPGGAPGPDFHYRNMKIETGKDSLARITDLPFATQQQDGQCYNFVDYDNDGDLDVCLTNWVGAPNRFFVNESGIYVAKAMPFTASVGTALSNSWGDYDNDGDLDVIISNGPPAGSGQPAKYYQNDGNGNLVDTNVGFAAAPGTSSVTNGDYDNDGDLDVFVNGNLAGRGLYQNTSLTANNGWVNITCAGTTSNRAAIGAKLRLKAIINGSSVWQMREISAQNTFQGQNDLRVHFGLGDATKIDSLIIQYLGGATDIFTNLTPNQFYTTNEGQNDISVITSSKQLNKNHIQGFKAYPNPPADTITLEQIAPLSGDSIICTIFDNYGKIMKQQKLQDMMGQKVPFNTKELPAGQYYIHLKIGAKQQTLTMTIP